MALRISAKRVAATLKARNGSIADNMLSMRQASQATAAATNLSEEARNDIYVRRPIILYVIC
jgi:acetylornithine aminotransferase